MTRFWEVLQIGLLSMFFAEILTAASPFWFLNPFGWLVTLPLYLFHTVLLLSIAQKLEMTKISQYYLLGTIFGLYEAWITKVLWSGYPVEIGEMRDPILGIIAEVATLEFVILVFFYHPIYSFILPIIAYQLIQNRTNHESQKIFIFIKISRGSKVISILSFIFTSAIIVNNFGFNLVLMAFSIFGSFILIFIVHRLIKRRELPYDKNHIILGKRGMVGSIIFLLLLYILTFFVFTPEYLPGMLGYIIIIIFYIIPIAVLWIGKGRELDEDIEPVDEVISFKMIRRIAIGFILTVIVFTIIPILQIIAIVAIHAILLVCAPILYALMIKSSL